MSPATAPRAACELRILVVGRGAPRVHAASVLPELLSPGDLVVVNDAATLPASLPATTDAGEVVEIRVLGARPGAEGVRFTAALLGAGDHRTRTEERPPPPRVRRGERLRVGGAGAGAGAGAGLEARVVRVAAFSERLVDLAFSIPEASSSDAPDAIWAALYRAGRPVQYAHVPAPLALWDVQNAWASRPWAVEMPSAGRALTTASLLALRARGIGVARVTHAAGLSATGDPEIDRRLPLPERFEVPAATASAIARARALGGRVVAVGTSVVRALESAARVTGRAPLAAASGITDLHLGPGTPRLVVDAVVTGVHDEGTSHLDLLGAFAPRGALQLAREASARAGLLGHELGDAWLVWADSRAGSATVAA